MPDLPAPAANHFVLPNLRDAYVELAQIVVEHGDPVAPRGYQTRELRGVTMVFTDPADVLPLGIGRDPKLAIGAAEALLLCGGISDPTLLTSVSGTFRRFLDGGVLHGAYGPRVAPQIPGVLRKLSSDPDTRQAYISIWDPAYDQQDARDLPCTTAFNFHIRKNEDGAEQLHMYSTMRSQDVFLGLAYDAFMFTQLGFSIAHALNIEFATLTHHVHSFHAYERNFDDILAMRTTGLPRPDFLPTGFGFHTSRDTFWDRARTIHAGQQPGIPTASEAWFHDTLEPYARLTQIENFTR